MKQTMLCSVKIQKLLLQPPFWIGSEKSLHPLLCLQVDWFCPSCWSSPPSTQLNLDLVAKASADELGEPVCIGGDDALKTLSLADADVLFRYEDFHLVGWLNIVYNKCLKTCCFVKTFSAVKRSATVPKRLMPSATHFQVRGRAADLGGRCKLQLVTHRCKRRFQVTLVSKTSSDQVHHDFLLLLIDVYGV